MKIQTIQYTNFRNVPDGDYELKGRDVILLADNALGKSNFMNALLMLFNAIPQKNILREGSDNAEVKAVCAQFQGEIPVEGTEHVFKMRAWKKNGDGPEVVALEVRLPSGESYDTKSRIGQVAGELCLEHDFVSLSKTPDGKRRQVEIVKSYMDKEIVDGLDAEKNKENTWRKDRTEVGREVDRLKGWIATQGMDRRLIEDNAAKDLIDISALSAQVSEAAQHNARREGITDRIKQRSEALAKAFTEIRNLELKIESLKKEIHQMQIQDAGAETFLKENPEFDIATLQSQISQVVEMNKIIERAKMMKIQVELLSAQEEQYGELTAKIGQGEQAITDTIQSMPFPIPGMSFTLDGEAITYQDKLVDEEHLSTGEIMLIEAMLRISKAPNVGCLFIGRGESLGVRLFNEIRSAAHQAGMQVITEQLDRGKEELTLQFIPEVVESNRK